MHALMRQLLADGPVVTDGAWGTQLQARGLGQGECPDLWNLSHPEVVEQVARDYIDAGSQVVLTNTFRSNRVALEGAGQSVDVVELNRVGAAISKRAADGRAAVFASIGPSGKMLLTGEIDESALRAAFGEQAAALADGGADAVVIETMGDLAEARLAVEAAKTTGLPVVACMCYDSGKDLDRTMMGVTPERAATELEAAGADCLGANCGQGIAEYVAVCRRLAKASDLPVWIKANAGIPTVEDGQIVYHTTPDGFAQHAAALVTAGANFLGGCCGTTPQFIAALSKALGG